MKTPRVHKIFFETQWPRIMEIQKRYARAHQLLPDFPWFRKEYAARIEAHIEAIHNHRVWMIKQYFGEDTHWVSTYIDRVGPFKTCDRGTGYRGEILQYVFWNEDEDDTEHDPV